MNKCWSYYVIVSAAMLMAFWSVTCRAQMNALHDEEMDTTIAARASEIPFYGDLILKSKNSKAGSNIEMNAYTEEGDGSKKINIHTKTIKTDLPSSISPTAINLITRRNGMSGQGRGNVGPGSSLNNYNTQLISNTGIGSSNPGLSIMYGNQNPDMVRNSLTNITPGVGMFFENYNTNLTKNISFGATPAGTSFGSVMTNMGSTAISAGTSSFTFGFGF